MAFHGDPIKHPQRYAKLCGCFAKAMRAHIIGVFVHYQAGFRSLEEMFCFIIVPLLSWYRNLLKSRHDITLKTGNCPYDNLLQISQIGHFCSPSFWVPFPWKFDRLGQPESQQDSALWEEQQQRQPKDERAWH